MKGQVFRWPSIHDAQARLALQCAVSLLIACIVMWLLPFPKPYWLALTAFIVTANSLGETAEKSLERIIGTVLGLIAGTLAWLAVSPMAWLAAAILGVCVFAIYYERAARYRTMLFWLSFLLSLLFHLADAPGSFYLARLADTFIGTGIAVLVTMVLLPVRTGEAVRRQIAVLLGFTAEKLRRMASSLALPGRHSRTGALAETMGASEALSGLGAAEGLEALLLHRPRAERRQRAAAAERIGRCLLYADQLMPLLPAETEIINALREVSVEIEHAAEAVRMEAVPRPLIPLRCVADSHRAALSSFHAGRLTRDQFEAALRLFEALAVLAAAVDQVAQTAPAGVDWPARQVQEALPHQR